MNQKYFLKTFSTYLFYTSIFIFLIAFNFQDTRTGGWYQQWLPNLNGESLKDITFLDSLTGYGITNSYIIKTTNGGDNWVINTTANLLFTKIHFINKDTGYVSAGLNKLYKTYNGGNNWTIITLPTDLYPISMFVLNKDTLWLCDSEGLTGGLFISTNGGYSWFKQFYSLNYNPERIYMFNSRIGFMENTVSTFKTTNGGNNWSLINENQIFSDLFFVDSLTGWKNRPYKTTDGGLTWVDYYPYLPQTFTKGIYQFSKFNKDTIWGVGGNVYYGGGYINVFGIIYKTTNGGNNWGYQQPDTSIKINKYYFCNFFNRRNGWSYALYGGIHTNIGGNDTTFYTNIKNKMTSVSNDFILYQNYPNPFNQISNIKYQILNVKSRNIIIKVFDINGKEIETLLNKKQSSGIYEVKFDGSNLSTGVYFYTLFVDGNRIDTKKAILIK